MGGSYELDYRLWAQFTFSAVRVNVDVTRSRDEVLVSSYSLLLIFHVACVHPICWLFQSIILNRMFPRILSRCFNWAKSHGSCSVEFEKEGEKVRVFLRTWDVDTYKRVCVATLDRYSSDPHQEISVLGRIVDALGPDVRWRQSAVARPSLWKLSLNIWAVGIAKNSLTTQFLIFAYLDGVYSGQLPVCSGAWTGSR